jgi:hypothetical protein
MDDRTARFVIGGVCVALVCVWVWFQRDRW